MKLSEKKRLSQLNPFRSVVKVNRSAAEDADLLYIGVKNDWHIPAQLVRTLKNTGKYEFHTVDRMAQAGRAVDLMLVNPITGRWMTGSSSGTAVNVFLGINDLGIGTDGGGSVLAPAMSLNLFGFMSPLIEKDHMDQFSKKSTDGIMLRPSIGFITRDFDILTDAVRAAVNLPESTSVMNVLISSENDLNYDFPTQKTIFPDIYGSREPMISFLNRVLGQCDFLVSREGPVDVNGFGDTVFGHFDENTAEIQRTACKGLIRAANMAHATALVIPDKALGCGTALICESVPTKISNMLAAAASIGSPKDELTERYFRNPETWFRSDFNTEDLTHEI